MHCYGCRLKGLGFTVFQGLGSRFEGSECGVFGFGA